MSESDAADVPKGSQNKVAATLVERGFGPTCYGYCGSLGWTVEKFGRVTHKESCPHRCEPWCQSHPDGCPEDGQPIIWREWQEKLGVI